jgi:CubicO group peptidase (beta-lactamase class C family)
MSLDEWVESISGKELSSRPGEEYAYSNVNYDLLGAVIARVTGRSYEDYMYEEILLPLGLTNTYVGMPDGEKSTIHGARLGYRLSFEYEIPVYEGRIPAGYFYSNIEDMAKWIRIWKGSADIHDGYGELISRVKTGLNEQGDYYSGWEMFENDVIGHSGGTPNYSSRIVYSDKEDIGICVLTNMNVAASTDGLCNGIYLMAAGGKADKLPMDVWTVFDLIFSAVSVVGILMMVLMLKTKKHGVIIGIGMTALILLIAVCTVMPAVFGAGLKEILFTWAPYSFAGGLLILAVNVLAAILTTRRIKNKHG